MHRDGPIFDKALRFYFDRSGLDPNRVEAIVLVEVERAEPVTSPAYDDGSAEADVEQRSLTLYGLRRTT